MGHQQTSVDEVLDGAIAPHFDPAHLPLRFAVADETADGGTRTVLLEHARVLVVRRRAGMAMHIAVPMKDYLGVAARVRGAGPEGADCFELALIHRDESLDVPLYAAPHDRDVVAQWRRWAVALGRPQLFERVDGSLVALDRRIGALEAEPALARRRRVGRERLRPRFMRRRRMGQPITRPAPGHRHSPL